MVLFENQPEGKVIELFDKKQNLRTNYEPLLLFRNRYI